MLRKSGLEALTAMALVVCGVSTAAWVNATEPDPVFSLQGRTCAFSPDGKTLATGSADGAVRLWDVESGMETAMLQGHAGEVWSVAFSPDGKTLASGSDDSTIRLWDAATGESVAVLEGHARRVQRVLFSPDGETILSSCIDNSAKLWDVATRENSATLAGDLFGAFSPDGKTVLVGDFFRITLVDLKDVRATRQLEFTTDIRAERMRNVVFSPSGDTIAVVSGRSGVNLRLFDTGTCQAVGDHRYLGDALNVAFSPDGRSLALGGKGGPFLHDIASGTVARRYEAPDAYVQCVAFSADGRILAGGGGNGRDLDVRLWETESGRSIAAYHIASAPRQLNFAYEAQFSADGKALAVKGYDGAITVWDVPELPFDEE